MVTVCSYHSYNVCLPWLQCVVTMDSDGICIEGLVKEEETQRMKHEHERAVERFKSECEREKHSLQKQHSADLEANIDKTNTRLKNLGYYP